MSDGGGTKASIGQIAQDVGEALVDPVVDQAEEAVEQAQSVVSNSKQIPPDPQDAQKQQAEQIKRDKTNQDKRQWAEATIARYKKIDEEQAEVRMQKKQVEQNKQQEEQVEKQEKGFELQQQVQKSTDLTSLQKAARSREIKGGVGG